MNYKRIGSIVFLIVLIIITAITIARGNDMEAVIVALKTLQTEYLLAGIAVALFFVSAEGIMIWYLLRAIQEPVRLFRCIKYSFIGFLFSGITPSATGGQPAQLYYMKKDGIGFANGTLALMSVALMYKFILVLMGLGLLLFWRTGLTAYLGSYIWIYYLGLFLNAAVVIVLAFIMGSPGCSKHIVLGIERFLVKIRILKPSGQRIEKALGAVADYQSAVEFIRHHPFKILVITMMTILQRLSCFFLTYLIYLGFGLSGAGFFPVMALQAVVYISVDMLPLPGSVGASELVYSIVYLSIFKGEYLTASLCVSRGLSFYMLLIVSFGITVVNHIITARRQRLLPHS